MRALVAIFAIVCSLIVTTIALTPSHGHSKQRTCDVCISAHLPLHPAVVGIAVTAPSRIVWRQVREYEERFTEFSSGSADCRAPPFES